jgi:hypothetical protein
MKEMARSLNGNGPFVDVWETISVDTTLAVDLIHGPVMS